MNAHSVDLSLLNTLELQLFLPSSTLLKQKGVILWVISDLKMALNVQTVNHVYIYTYVQTHTSLTGQPAFETGSSMYNYILTISSVQSPTPKLLFLYQPRLIFPHNIL